MHYLKVAKYRVPVRVDDRSIVAKAPIRNKKERDMKTERLSEGD